jgi:hypothetical protein
MPTSETETLVLLVRDPTSSTSTQISVHWVMLLTEGSSWGGREVAIGGEAWGRGVWNGGMRG